MDPDEIHETHEVLSGHIMCEKCYACDCFTSGEDKLRAPCTA